MSEGKRCGTCDDVLVNGNCSVCGGTAYDDVVCLRARCAELEAARDALKLELADATVGDAIAQSESDAENERLRAALEKAERELYELKTAVGFWKAEEECWKATEKALHEERDTAIARAEKAERERDEATAGSLELLQRANEAEDAHDDAVSVSYNALRGTVSDAELVPMSLAERVRMLAWQRDASRRENAELQKRLARVEEILAERVNENAALKLECERLRLAECDAQADLDRALDGTAELREALRHTTSAILSCDECDALATRTGFHRLGCDEHSASTWAELEQAVAARLLARLKEKPPESSFCPICVDTMTGFEDSRPCTHRKDGG